MEKLKNDEKEYIAHKCDDGTVQALREHLEGVANLAAGFASDFDAVEQGRLVGLAHDIGKYSVEFQKRIKEEGPKVDHSSAGAYLCAKLGQNYAAFCVAGHHSGLPDLGGLDDMSEGTLRARLNKAKRGDIPNYAAWEKEIGSLPSAVKPVFEDNKGLEDAFFIRMLYSCLVDADYLDTENFMKADQIRRGTDLTIEVLECRLDGYVKKWFPPKGELNEKRCAILQNCIEQAKTEQGIFSLTVPTGGGKTVASLAFAIKHARTHNLKRVIYVIPYTSIIEQTADEFRKILGEEAVLEHHSNIEYDPSDCDDEMSRRKAMATENWDMPVIVTTAVQFFESLYANKSSKSRKLHNISKSVVIFDEAQMLPIAYLRPCVFAITELVKNYHSTAVLCTATQPSLGNLLNEFLGKETIRELCPKELSSDPVFQRNRIVNKGIMTWDEIASNIEQHRQILCIVNSRKNAQEVFERIKGEGSYHLSTLMIPEERKRVLKEIRERLKQGKICRVVSTSLIEAGVDVDFPAVMRELAGLDSILQAAGRCNREGKRSIQESIVMIFRTENPSPPIFSANISACKYAMETYAEINTEECIMCYFDNLYDFKGAEEQDKNHILDLLGNNRLSFKEAAERFHLIDNDTYTVYVPLDEGKSLIERRKAGDISRSLLRQLGRFGVNIYKKHLEALYAAGDVEQIGETEWILLNESLYDRLTGLSMDADSGKAIFI